MYNPPPPPLPQHIHTKCNVYNPPPFKWKHYNPHSFGLNIFISPNYLNIKINNLTSPMGLSFSQYPPCFLVNWALKYLSILFICLIIVKFIAEQYCFNKKTEIICIIVKPKSYAESQKNLIFYIKRVFPVTISILLNSKLTTIRINLCIVNYLQKGKPIWVI